MDGVTLGTLLEPVIDLVTIAVVGLGVYYARRQEITRYRDAKTLLVLSWAIFMGVVVVQLAGDIYPTPMLERIYTLLSVPLILADVAILTLLSYVIYARQSEPRFRDRMRAMFKPRNRISGLLLIAFIAYLVCLVLYVLLFQPFTIMKLVDVFGSQTESTLFDSSFLPMLLFVMIGYPGYSCSHLLLAARKLANRATARALRIFALGWVVTGISLFVFVGYSVNFGIDLSAIGYLIVAISFSAAVRVFRRESLLADFLEPMKPVVPVTHPFTGRLAARRPPSQVGRGIMLLEVDPSSRYDEVVRDFAVEQISSGSSLFVFTSRGKPIYEALREVPQTRFFVMTGGVTNPKPGGRPLEVLVPHGDHAVLLNIIERTLTTDPESRISLVFDSVSDLILTSGPEKSYKLLKQLLEMTSDPRVTALFLVVGGAHEDKVMNLVMSLFATQLTFDASGLKVMRHSQPPGSSGAQSKT